MVVRSGEYVCFDLFSLHIYAVHLFAFYFIFRHPTKRQQQQTIDNIIQTLKKQY